MKFDPRDPQFVAHMEQSVTMNADVSAAYTTRLFSTLKDSGFDEIKAFELVKTAVAAINGGKFLLG